MKRTYHKNHKAGFTLIELLVTIGIFSIIMAFFYPCFENVKNQVNELSDKQELTQKGQRVLDYITEELRMAGLFVGARPAITFCNTAGVNSLEHADGNPRDSVTFLTSERITTTSVDNPFLCTALPTTSGSNNVTVNAPVASVSALSPSAGTADNASAFITFDTLQPNLGTLVYQVTNFGGSVLTLLPALDQNVNTGSNAYAVVRKRFEVDASRNLRLTRWDSACATDSSLSADIVTSYGPGSANGGVDGFQVEYTLADGSMVATLTAQNIVNVRAITVWILLRSDFPSSSYKNTSSYTLGVANPVIIAVNDHYRRGLFTRTVEVKNVGL